jgi:transposase-like protein
VIVVAIRWYLRHNLSYRDVEELPVERGIEVDHVTGISSRRAKHGIEVAAAPRARTVPDQPESPSSAHRAMDRLIGPPAALRAILARTEPGRRAR